SLDRCGAFELIDVMRNHQFALIRREAKWELVESSERKKAKDDVARSEAKYRSLVENTGQGVATTDLKGRFTYVNETLCKMIGYDEKELLGKNFADFLHPDEKKRILNLFWEVLKTLRRKRLHLEFRVIHKKGHVLHWYSSPTAFRHKGRILGFSAIITDITDRKKIEKVLKNAAREWYATFDAISDAVLVTDLEGKVLRCNKAMADLMRRPFHEIVGDTCWEVLYGVPGPLEGSPVSLMKKGRSRQTAFLQKGERYFQIGVDPLLDETGDLIGAVHIMTDITDRKRAERRIQEQNEFLNSVLESFAHPLYVVDVNDYTVKMANSAAGLGKISKDSTCYAAHYKRNRPCEGIEHPCPIEKVRRTKQPVVVEHLHYDKDGSPRHTEVHTYPIFDDEGNVSQVIEYCLDTTDRKRIEEALRKSESRYRSLFENMPTGFAYCKMLLDENNRPTNFLYLEVNDAFERLTGLKRENVVGKKITEVIPSIKDANPEVFDIYGKVALTGKETEFDLHLKPLQIWLSISVYSPGKGYFIAVFNNITERKKAEEALRESEERYALAQQAARIGTWDWEIVANRMKCSSEMLRIWDVNGEDYTRREDFANLYHPDDKNRIAKAVEDALSGRKLYNTEYRIITPTGTVKWLHVQGKVFIDRNGKPVRMLGITQDITRRKKAEKKIRDYQERLRSLVSELTLVEEQQKRNLATELHDSIGQLLALCRIKLGELEKVTKATDVRSLAEEVEKGLEEIIWHTRSLTLRLGPPLLYELGLEVALEWLVEYMEEQYGIQTKFRVDGKVDPIQEELRVFLFRAVQELMMNVARHGETDKAEVSVWRENRTMHITVKDRGVGFNSAILDAPSGKDSGFGLFSIRERIKYFGGEASVQSKPGKGTQVTLVVPLKALRSRKGDK
ncbi:MAG: PAS domain S-box protein, partial [Candidatus Aerophobetes bacterium]